VFEPFFTTKGSGKGSGLGLSIVEGFVTQSGGHIRIDTAIGAGTDIGIFLPRASGIAAAEANDEPIVQGRGELILVVEDNPHLRRTSTATVRMLGYTVLEASDAETAMALLDAHPDTSLLFTDVVLPGGVNGFELAREALRRRPDLAVLFVSGFFDPSLVAEPHRRPGARYESEILTKPFRRSDLAARLRSALNNVGVTVATEPVC
jgi:CheY-like chemotaxis protein